MRLLVSREAVREIRDARNWWRDHRPGAPRAVSQELRRAFDLLGFSPRAGSLVAHARLTGLRRIHLARIRYDLYYRVREDGSAVEVLALWHTSRGEAPPI